MDRVKHHIEILADIFDEEAQHEVVVLLEQLILTAVSTIGIGTFQVLRAIQFDHYARIGAMLMKRLGPFYARIREGAGAGDPDLTALLETTAKERLVGATEVVESLRKLGPLRPGLTAARARDIVWTHTSYEMWDLLVRQRGWSARAYADYLGSSMSRALLPNEAP